VGARFAANVDGERAPTQHYVTGLLERGVRVLVYVGENDYICNWIGNLGWSEQLDWSGALWSDQLQQSVTADITFMQVVMHIAGPNWELGRSMVLRLAYTSVMVLSRLQQFGERGTW
jgi:hypothetical protein